MKNISLTVISILLSLNYAFSAEKQDLVCKLKDDYWHVFNQKTNKWIVNSGAKQDNEQFCKDAINSLKENALCVFANESYKPFNANNGAPIGKEGATTFARCAQYLSTAKDGMLCSFVDTNTFNVFRISDGLKLGNGEAASTLERCHDYIKTSSKGLVCIYAGADKEVKKFQSVRISDNKVYGFPLGTYADSLEKCRDQIPKFELDENGQERKIDLEVRRLQKILVDEFSPFLKKLTREVNFYTYLERGELNVKGPAIDLRSEEVFKGLEKWRKSIDDYVPYERGWVGFGLYGAVNPVDSQAYATNDWLLAEIKFKGNSTFLDLRVSNENNEHNYALHFSDQAKSEFEETCKIAPEEFKYKDVVVDGQAYNWSINKVNFNRNRICHVALMAALKQLNVEFLVYNWYWVRDNNQRELNGGCERHETPAIVVVKPISDKSRVKSFDFKGHNNHIPEYQRIYQIARLRSSSPTASWPQYRSSTGLKINVEAELEGQFGCKKQFSEDHVSQ